MKRGKKYAESAKLVEALKLYETEEALGLCLKTGKAKFDETVELHIRLGVDSRHADQQVRGAVVLPNGTGKTVRVLAFCKGDNVQKALDAGADYAGSDEYVAKIQSEGWLDFDVVIATPDMMGVIGRLGKVLGPRGLMPNPKVGTVTPDVAGAVKNAKAGQVQFRADKSGIVHGTIGRASFGPDALRSNLTALIDALQKARPQAAKGIYLKKVAVSSTMGIGVRVDTATVNAAVAGQ